MKNEILHNEIRNLTEVIREQQEMILAHEGSIPRIELDILLGNIRKLYETLLELNKINHPNTAPVQPVPAPDSRKLHTDELIAHISQVVPKVEEPVLTADAPAKEFVADVKEQTPVHIQPEELITRVDTRVEADTSEIANEAVLPQASLAKERTKEYVKPASRVQHTASLFDDPVTVAEKFKGGPSLYDKISANKQDNSLADKLLKNPVSDLKKSIGINEKFSFINELFDGDLNSYNEYIDKLNNSETFERALGIIESELTSKYNWNGESDSYIKLKNLVERRFSA